MKNFTINERQEIYEQLLRLGCDDLLAALLAKRADAAFMLDMGECVDEKRIHSWIIHGFDWFLTTEGHEFWHHMYECVRDFEGFDEDGEDFSDHGGGSTLEDYSPPVAPATVAIESAGLDNIYQYPQEPLSLWTRVKLFFGKLSYGV